MSEKEFMGQVVEYARWCNWLVYHTHDCRRSTAGFLDLVLVRQIVVWAELKSEHGVLTQAQMDWMSALRAAGQTVYLWTPRDWPEIERVLAL